MGKMDNVIEMLKPEYSEWQCEIFGFENYIWYPLKNKTPNWFWRWMQYLFFGNKWTKKKK